VGGESHRLAAALSMKAPVGRLQRESHPLHSP
jgi:hypothetical protein